MTISFRDAASSAIANSLCAVLAVGDNVYRLFDWGLDPKGRGNVAAGVRRLLCNIDPDNDTPPAPSPFEGGQCECHRYRVDYTGRNFDSEGNEVFFTLGSVRVRGPILGKRPRPNGRGFELLCRGMNNIGTIYPACLPVPEWLQAVGNVGTVNTIWEIEIGAAPDGDDCGDPPPEYPEPEPVVGPTTNITYNIDESTQITVPLAVVFAPIFVKATGQFSFPIRVNIGEISFSGTFDVSPTVNINIYPDGSGGGNGGTTDKPDDDIPPIDIPDEDETPDFESRIIGVFIRSNIDTNIVRASGIPAGGNLPEIWAPRLANCKFLIRSRTTTGWTKDIDVKNANQYIPCPHPGGAVDVRVFPQQGVTVAVEPHRAVPLLPDLPPTDE